MGYTTYARGEIRIDPPLTASEIKGSPFMPDVARQRGTNRDVMFQIQMSEIETPEGTLFKRSAVAIVQSWEDEPRNYDIVAHVQELIDLHGTGRTFTGHFDMEGEEPGDIWRLYVRDGKAVRVDPVITWPGEPA